MNKLSFDGIILVILSIFIFWIGTIGRLYPSNDLNTYPRFIGNIDRMGIEKFKGSRSSGYFELAFYSNVGKRFFIRSPDDAQLREIGSKIPKNGEIAINYLPKDEGGRGYRVVNIESDGSIYSFTEVAAEQKHKEKIFIVLGMLLFLLGCYLVRRKLQLTRL
jgi:hypothetical protein